MADTIKKINIYGNWNDEPKNLIIGGTDTYAGNFIYLLLKNAIKDKELDDIVKMVNYSQVGVAIITIHDQTTYYVLYDNLLRLIRELRKNKAPEEYLRIDTKHLH